MSTAQRLKASENEPQREDVQFLTEKKNCGDTVQQAIAISNEDAVHATLSQTPKGVFEMAQMYSQKVVANPYFDAFILFLILVNSILLALYQYRQPGCTFNELSDNVIDPILLGFFTCECGLKIIAWGLFCSVKGHTAYLLDAWNWLDFVVVVTGWIFLVANGDGFAFLRVFRVLRPLRSLTMLREMRVLVNTVLKSIPRLFDVTLMGLFIFTVFAIIGITLWNGIFYRQCRSIPQPELSFHKNCWIWNVSSDAEGHLCGGDYTCPSGSFCGGHPKDPDHKFRPLFNGLPAEDGHLGLNWCDGQPIMEPKKVFPPTDFIHFDHIGGALLIVFQSMTMEGWTDIMYWVQDGAGNVMATIYFFMVILITSFFVLNVILAVIDESFQDLSAADEEEVAEEERAAEEAAGETHPGVDSDVAAVATVTPQFTSLNENFEDVWYDHKIVRIAFAVVDSEACKYTVLFFIAANAVVMMLEKFPPDPEMRIFQKIANTVFMWVFAAEMVAMLVALGPIRYVKNPLTCFDGIIVISSFFQMMFSDGGGSLSFFRVFRLLRVVFKIASKWEAFRVLLKSIIKTMFSLGYFALLFFLVMYVLTLMGMNFFATEFHFDNTDDPAKVLNDGDAVFCPGTKSGLGTEPNMDCIPRANFDTFVWAFTTVFQIMSGENWNTVMYDAMRAGPLVLATFYFVFMIVFGQIMMLNLFLTILMAKFDQASDDLEKEEREKVQKTLEKKNGLKTLHQEMKMRKAVEAVTGLNSSGLHRSPTHDEMFEGKKDAVKTSVLNCALVFAETSMKRQTSDTGSTKSNGKEEDKLRTAGMSTSVDADYEVATSLPGQIVMTPRGQKSGQGKEAASPAKHETLENANDAGNEVQPLKADAVPVAVEGLTKSMAGAEEKPARPSTEIVEASAKKATVPYQDTTKPASSDLGVGHKASEDNSWKLQVPERSSFLNPQEFPEDTFPETYALLIFPRRNPIRKLCIMMVGRQEFDWVILTCILFSSLIMAMRHPLRDPAETFTQFMDLMDKVFAIIFVIEMVMKLIAMGLLFGPKTYLKSKWNWIDGVVVLVSIIDLAGISESMKPLKTLRILRAFRPLRVISRNQNLKVVVTTIFESLPELATLFIVAMLFLLIFAIFFLTYLNGYFFGCSDTDGMAFSLNLRTEIAKTFVTPLCLPTAADAGSSTACARGKMELQTWEYGTCPNDCKDQPLYWQRPSADTPICVGRCSHTRGAFMPTPPAPPLAVCPAPLTRPEELPPVDCNTGGLKLEATPGIHEEAEKVGVAYVEAYQKDRVLPCGGNVSGVSCKDVMCPHKMGQPTSEGCVSECKRHPTFCYETCNKGIGDWESKWPGNTPACRACLTECEAWCECHEYCEPLVKDAALCVEQGKRWGQTISQNFNTITNGIVTLFEISTTEGWVDVMYEAVDGRGWYLQPQRDNFVFWAFAFIIFIFFSNMFIINLSVGVIVDNFIKLKKEAMMVNSDGAKVREDMDGNHYCGRPLPRVNVSGTRSLGAVPCKTTSDDVVKTTSMFGMGSSKTFECCSPHNQCPACQNYVDPMMTPRQAKWVQYQKSLFLTEPFELRNLHLIAPRQRQAYELVTSPVFENTIMAAIILNTLLMACITFPMPTPWWKDFLGAAGYIFAGVFTAELIIKYFALRWSYWKDNWNLFDFFCVVATFVGIIINVTSDADIGSLTSCIRIFRVARLFRLLRFMKGVNKIFMALLCSLPKLANVSILLVLLLVLYSILGVQLFAKIGLGDTLNYHGNFQNFFSAFKTLFRSMTGEAWNEIMHDLDKEERDYLLGPRISDDPSWCSPPKLFNIDKTTFPILEAKCLIKHPNQCREYPYFAKIYFVSFTFITAFTVLNLVIAVILEGYEDGKAHTEGEVIDACKKLWKQYDPNYTMFIPLSKAFDYVGEVLHSLQGIDDDWEDQEEELAEMNPPPVRQSASGFMGLDLACVPMKYAKNFDLQWTPDGMVAFHDVVKLILRLMTSHNDPSILAELEETDKKMSDREREKLKTCEAKQRIKNLPPEMKDEMNAAAGAATFGLAAQVAASKLQRRWRARQARLAALEDMQKVGIDTSMLERSPRPGSRPKNQESENEAKLPGPMEVESLPNSHEGTPPEDSTHSLQPRNPANCDGLDEPGWWRTVSVTPKVAELGKMSIVDLKKRARAAGANDDEIIDAIDEEEPKEAIIKLIFFKADQVPPVAG
jgi:hypothetical protein